MTVRISQQQIEQEQSGVIRDLALEAQAVETEEQAFSVIKKFNKINQNANEIDIGAS
jgi:hypothetical protein